MTSYHFPFYRNHAVQQQDKSNKKRRNKAMRNAGMIHKTYSKSKHLQITKRRLKIICEFLRVKAIKNRIILLQNTYILYSKIYKISR